MLKNYIENVFEKYDTDKNGVLDAQEMMAFFNDLYKNMGTENTINIEQAKAAIQSIDTNNDGNVDRAELFAAFKQLMAAYLFDHCLEISPCKTSFSINSNNRSISNHKCNR